MTVETTGAIPPQIAVTAVVVTDGDTPFLPTTLAAVRAQDRAPDEVLVIDVSANGALQRPDDLPESECWLTAPNARTLGQAVNQALAQGLGSAAEWLWLIHDDSVPEYDALATLLRHVENHPAVVIAGPKQRRWAVMEDGTPASLSTSNLLIEVGHTVSPLGRRMTSIDDTEIDQGQHDSREDVLAVGLAGALVRTQVWQSLRGTDPGYGVFGDGLDLCRRARRAGGRVVVVPAAVVHHAQASLLGLRDSQDPSEEQGRQLRRPPAEITESASFAQRRRSQLYHRLVHVSAPLLPLAWLGMLLWAPIAAAFRLALKEPRQARAEIGAALWNAMRVVPLLHARWNAARTATVPRRVLRPLLASWRQVYDEWRDIQLARAEAARARWRPGDLERAELRRLASHRRTGLAVVLVLAIGATMVVFGAWLGPLLGGGRVVGGSLLSAPGTLGDVWTAATSGWNMEVLGSAAPGDPLLLVLTVATALAGGSLQLAVNLMVLTAIPLATLAGWFAAGAFTRVVWARGVAALAWAATPTFLFALSTGRLGAVITHVTLPWVALALIRTIGAQARDDVSELALPEESGWLDSPSSPSLVVESPPVVEPAETTSTSLGSATPLAGAPSAQNDVAPGDSFGLNAEIPAAGVDHVIPCGGSSDLASGIVAGVDHVILRERSESPDPGQRVAPASPRRGSLGAAGAAGLLLAIAVAAAPALLPVAILTVLVAVIAAPRARRILPLTLLPALVVGAPFWWRVLLDVDLRHLLADPLGAPGAGIGTGWQPLVATNRSTGPALLLGQPALPDEWAGFAQITGAQARELAPTILLTVVVLGFAVMALFRRRAGAVRLAWLLAAIGLMLALVSVAAGFAPTAGLSVLMLACGAAALLALPAPNNANLRERSESPELAEGEHTPRRARRALGLVAVGAFALLPIAGFTAWAVTAANDGAVGDLRASRGGVVPAIGRQMQDGARSARVLQLQQSEGVVEWTLLRADGTWLIDASVAVPVVTGPPSAPVPAAGRGHIGQLAAEVSVGADPNLAVALADLGIGAVQLPPGNYGGRTDLAATLDMVPGLIRVTEGDGVLLWRVAVDDRPEPGWAWLIYPGEPSSVLPSQRGSISVRTPVEKGSGPTRLMLAATASPNWVARLAGHHAVAEHQLVAVEADGLQAFDAGMAEMGMTLTVSFQHPRHGLWLTGMGLVIAVFALLALPVGRRRGR